MTAIPDELNLAGAGLVYQQMDPFSVAVFADGRRVRFFRSVEATLDSIAAVDPGEAMAYRAFPDRADPILTTIMPAIRGSCPCARCPAGSGAWRGPCGAVPSARPATCWRPTTRSCAAGSRPT